MTRDEYIYASHGFNIDNEKLLCAYTAKITEQALEIIKARIVDLQTYVIDPTEKLVRLDDVNEIIQQEVNSLKNRSNYGYRNKMSR